MKKFRYIVLTDIFDGFEVDDIESMIRLLLYSNEIDIEALIATTSCFVKNDTIRREGIIHDLIDAYEEVLPNLKVHADGWPEADYLQSITCSGIDEFGLKPGKGFADEKYCNIAGVRKIIEVVDRDDDRPLYVGLWAGANTLAQAIWQVERTRSAEEFDKFLSKLRLYGISDQDHASRWLREKYGDRLFFIVSPTKGSWFGNWDYWRATWPGMSSDNAKHGSEDGIHKTKGFSGSRADLIDNDWIEKNIICKGPLGAKYPLPKYIVEGDTPTYLWLIPNGLNDPEHPDYGGWGGRYEFYKPLKSQFKVEEKYPIWTNASDTVVGTDGKKHTSPQATIWRWREAYQNAFAARMDWTVKDKYEDASHPPVVKAKKLEREIKAGEIEELVVEGKDKDGGECGYNWYIYREAGNCTAKVSFSTKGNRARILVPESEKGKTIHVICEVSGSKAPKITNYARFVLTIV